MDSGLKAMRAPSMSWQGLCLLTAAVGLGVCIGKQVTPYVISELPSCWILATIVGVGADTGTVSTIMRLMMDAEFCASAGASAVRSVTKGSR